MADLAAYNGVLYGISLATDSELYSINTTTAAATAIGLTGDSLNGLVFGSNGSLYASGGDSLYLVNASTGAASLVGSGSGEGTYNSSGDLEFVGSTLYITNLATGNGNDQSFRSAPRRVRGRISGRILELPTCLALQTSTGLRTAPPTLVAARKAF